MYAAAFPFHLQRLLVDEDLVVNSFLRFRIYVQGDRALFRTLSSIENTLHSSHVQNCMQ